MNRMIRLLRKETVTLSLDAHSTHCHTHPAVAKVKTIMSITASVHVQLAVVWFLYGFIKQSVVLNM